MGQQVWLVLLEPSSPGPKRALWARQFGLFCQSLLHQDPSVLYGLVGLACFVRAQFTRTQACSMGQSDWLVCQNLHDPLSVLYGLVGLACQLRTQFTRTQACFMSQQVWLVLLEPTSPGSKRALWMIQLVWLVLLQPSSPGPKRALWASQTDLFCQNLHDPIKRDLYGLVGLVCFVRAWFTRIQASFMGQSVWLVLLEPSSPGPKHALWASRSGLICQSLVHQDPSVLYGLVGLACFVRAYSSPGPKRPFMGQSVWLVLLEPGSPGLKHALWASRSGLFCWLEPGSPGPKRALWASPSGLFCQSLVYQILYLFVCDGAVRPFK